MHGRVLEVHFVHDIVYPLINRESNGNLVVKQEFLVEFCWNRREMDTDCVATLVHDEGDGAESG